MLATRFHPRTKHKPASHDWKYLEHQEDFMAGEQKQCRRVHERPQKCPQYGTKPPQGK